MINRRVSRWALLLASLCLLPLFSNKSCASERQAVQIDLMSYKAKMPKSLNFPEVLMGRAPSSLVDVQRLKQKSYQVELHYQQSVKNTHAFSGLYALGQLDQRLGGIKKGNNDYVAGIEWEVFKEGYYDNRHKQAKERVTTAIQLVELEKDMDMRALDEELYYRNRLRRSVQALAAKSMLNLTTRQLVAVGAQMNQGYVTRDEYAEYLNRKQDAKIRFISLTSEPLVKSPVAWFRIMNGAPTLQMATEEQLFKQAIIVSPDLKLQVQFDKRAEFRPEWKDDLSLRLYGHIRKRFGSPSEGIVGVRVRVPLDFQSSRDDLIEYEKDRYRLQTGAITFRMKQKISELRHEFQHHQARIAQMVETYLMLEKKMHSARKLEHAGLSSLKQTPMKDLAQYRRSQLALQEQVWLARLDILTVSLKLAAMIRTESVEDLYQSKGVPKTISNHYRSSHPSSTVKRKTKGSQLFNSPVKKTTQSERDAIAAMVNQWRHAWSAQDFAHYRSFYADQFMPEGGRSKQYWGQRKRRIFTLRKHIQVDVKNMLFGMTGSGTRWVQFSQHYEADGRVDRDHKQLLLSREHDAWKIKREFILAD